VKEKGIEELILSVEQLKKEGRFIYLKIVGSVKESYKKYLICLILQLGIENQVSFEGFIKFGNELLSLYRSSDIYILPSYHEGFPHSIWEASLTCTPIIVTKVGGIPGLVNDEMVYFIESKSVSSIVGAINHLLSDEIYSESLAQNIYRQCQKYTIEKCIEILKQTITENE
jgi:glycosyltransferase involved in cell wall biosynthesis